MRAEPVPSPPPRESCFVVFAQRADARIDLPAWCQHAERFFATRLGLAAEKRYGEIAPLVDSVDFVLSCADATQSIRSAFARPRNEEDLELARAAETRTGPTGLVLLARRCPLVWMVVREPSDDPAALRLAAILSSILLGPILDVAGPHLFGANTARAKLEKRPA